MPPKRSASMAGSSCDIRSFFKPTQATTSSSSPITTEVKATTIAQSADRRSTTPTRGTEMDTTTSREPQAVGMSSPVLSADSSMPPAVRMSPSTSSMDSSIPFPQIAPNTSRCPFKAQGESCKSGTFKDLKALANHCRSKHPGRIIVEFEDDPVLQDGTNRIPCRKGCGSVFSSYGASLYHSKSCDDDTVTVKDCPWPECTELSMDIRAYGTHAGMHVHDSRGLYRCSKCENRYCDLYLLASHESGCKGEDGELTARFDGVFRVNYQKSMTSEAPCVLAVVRASSEPPKAWKAGEEHLADGIKIWAKNLFDEFAIDYDSKEGIDATLVAMSYVHTSVAPTGQFSQAHTTTDPTRRAYYARAHKFTHNIDNFLEHSTARGTKPVILSIGLDGFACKATLILPWLQRSPPFTLIIRENTLAYGMDAAYFPQYPSGLYYGFFESQELVQALSTDKAVGDAVKNLLGAWKACQDWKDGSPAHNGRLIGRNGDHKRVPKKAKRGPITTGSRGN